ncbi:MAG: hypothetical protein FWC22_06980 [Treponema sp.]|nr:hypothetical protein [Treponema sp.]
MSKQFLIIILLTFLSSFIYADEHDKLTENISIEGVTDDIIDDNPLAADDEPSLLISELVSESEEKQQEILIDISGVTDTGILWKQFSLGSDIGRNAGILTALGSLGKGNRAVIDNLNDYLMSVNLSYKSGGKTHYIIVSACISAIMELGDSSSYQALFAAICAGYPEVIASEAFGALEVIPGNLHQFLLNVIWNNPPDEKLAAFRIAHNSDRFKIPERGQIAELALEQALSATEANINLSAMRYAAVLSLTQMRWTRANALAIKHYYLVQIDFSRGNVPKERFIEAIDCLGAVGDSQAALVLGLQLGLINSRTESTGVFDSEITLAIVQALGRIGDSAAFDHLFYVTNLSYGEQIKAAAREAIGSLKWSR